jgi:SAM-dependent methyltransferase
MSSSSGDEFDAYADEYGAVVQRSIDFAGCDHDFFTRRKAEELLELVSRKVGEPSSVRALDVGCGVGVTDAHLAGRLAELHGVDTSEEAIRRAAAANPEVLYLAYEGNRLPYDDGRFDLAFAICVMHHVEPASRASFSAELRRVVCPGGLIVVFEHNPWNPLTRLAVSRCEFDEDAVLLTPRSARGLLGGAGLRPVEQRYVILFPSDRPRLRALEHALRTVPLAAQYYVAAQR